MKKYVIFICFAVIFGIGFSFLINNAETIEGVNRGEIEEIKNEKEMEKISFELPKGKVDEVIFPFEFVEVKDNVFTVNAQISPSVEDGEIIQFAYNLAHDLIKLNDELDEVSQIKIKLVYQVFFSSLDVEEGKVVIIDFENLVLTR